MATKKKFRCGTAPSKGSPWHMSQVKKCNAESGGHWFDPSTLRFFRSRVSDWVHQGPGGIYFTSSEQSVSARGEKGPRMHTVHKFDPRTYRIDTVGEFQQYKTKAQADKAAKKLAGKR